MDDEVIEKLVIAKMGLMIRAPFFGNMASRMPLVNADTWCDTAATNGTYFYYNRDFINSLTIKQCEFVYCHEVLHCAFDHFERTGSRNKRLANIAQDYAINIIISDGKIGEHPPTILLDEKFRGMPWEEIYDILWDEFKDLPSLEDVLEKLEEMLLDHHLKEDDVNDNPDTPTLTKENLQQIKDAIKSAMIQAASVAGNNLPDAISRLVNAWTSSKIDWKDLVRLNIQSIVKSNYSFARPNRKSMGTSIILPGLEPEMTIDVAIAVDTSGSISNEDCSIFLGEILGIIEQFQDFKIDLWCFNTDIHNHKTFSQENSDELREYDITGNGGTDYDVNYTFMKENNINPKRFFMFTDGEPFSSWGDEDYCDTVFVIKGNPMVMAPWGTTIHYEDL
jgi:predicted metal-dependent peptidase